MSIDILSLPRPWARPRTLELKARAAWSSDVSAAARAYAAVQEQTLSASASTKVESF